MKTLRQFLKRHHWIVPVLLISCMAAACSAVRTTSAVTATADPYAGYTLELTCTKKEHTHTLDCQKTTMVLTCDEDHEHSASCYQTQIVFRCGLEAHQHTIEDCYRMVPKNTE